MIQGKCCEEKDILSIKKLFAPFLARASGRSFSTFHRSNFAINEIDASQFLSRTSSSPKPTSLVENTYGDRKNFLLLPVNYLTIPIRFFWVPLALYRPLGCVDPDPVLINVKDDISSIDEIRLDCQESFLVVDRSPVKIIRTRTIRLPD